MARSRDSDREQICGALIRDVIKLRRSGCRAADIDWVSACGYLRWSDRARN